MSPLLRQTGATRNETSISQMLSVWISWRICSTEDSCLRGLGWDLIFCVSDNVPDDTHASVPLSTLGAVTKLSTRGTRLPHPRGLLIILPPGYIFPPYVTQTSCLSKISCTHLRIYLWSFWNEKGQARKFLVHSQGSGFSLLIWRLRQISQFLLFPPILQPVFDVPRISSGWT